MNKFKRSMVRCILLLVCIGMFFCLQVDAQNPNGVISIKAGGVLNITNGSYLVTNADINNVGTLNNAGRIVLNGTATQNFPGIGSIPLMNILEVRNTGAGVVLNKSIQIYKELKLANGNLALGNFDVSIQSSIAQTGSISSISSGASVSYGTGRFIIERFINVGTGGHGKSWQLLAVPAIGKTIRDCWQESGASLAGYGTQVTHPSGVGSGFDLSTVNTSIKTYVSATGMFDLGPTNTTALIDNAKGYMLFVRGDRTVASGTGSTPTVLRIKGTIFTPASPPPSITIGSGWNESIGNPYASQIDFTQLVRTGGTDNKFYTWDPLLSGSYGVGAYQTISATNGWLPVPGGGNYAGVHKTIESGQAFFVHSTAASGTIGFTETAKVGGNILVTRGETLSSSRQFIRSTLYTNTGILVDGNAAAFDKDLSNKLDGDDAPKIFNGGENFGIKRGKEILSIEGRSTLSSTDTLFYYVKNLRIQQYKLLIIPVNIKSTTQPYFIDNFLKSSTPLSVNDSNYIKFNVTTDNLSARSDRFMIVFQPQTMPAAGRITLQAVANNDQTVSVNWQNTAESNVDQYIVEKSADGVSFVRIGTYPAKLNNNGYAQYEFKDLIALQAKTYYRIKILNDAGYASYSEAVAVSPLQTEAEFKVYPNPVADKVIHLFFARQFPGNYEITLLNSSGQVAWKGKVLLTAGSGNFPIHLPENLAPAVYHLVVVDKAGKSFQSAITIL